MFRFLGKEEAKACVLEGERARDGKLWLGNADVQLFSVRRMSSMDAEEKLVLNHIRDAGNMGASAVDI